MNRRRRVRIAAVVCAAGAFAACGDRSATTAAPAVFDLAHDPTTDISPVTDDRGEVMPADELRNALERDLAWHGITLVQTMRSIEADSPDADAWIAALAQNTDDIVEKIGALYGPAGADAFYQQWAQHTQFLADYAAAVREGDDGALDAAAADLATYADDSGHFLDRATGGILPAETATGLLNGHIAHMRAMIEAVGDGDHPAALSSALADNTYLSGIAQGLAGAFVAQHPDWFPGSTEGDIAAYCSLVTETAGDYLLRQLFADTPITDADDAFSDAVDRPLIEALGPLDGLAAPDAGTRVATARGALDTALATGRTGEP